MAVADGAGSAPHSDEGARLAVATAVAAVNKEVSKGGWRIHAVNPRWRRIGRQPRFRRAAAPRDGVNLLRYAIDRAHSAVTAYADARGLAPRDFAATLLVALATPRWIAAAQVGDGAIVAFNSKTGQAQTLCQSHAGEYANETVFITARPQPGRTIAHTGHASAKEYDAIGITTDGLENLALQMPQRLPIPGFWQPMFRHLRETGPEQTTDELNHFLKSDRVRAKSADDLTILIAVIA